MQAYKEIQVPVEKVKEVYEQFYKKLKELEQQAKEKEELNREDFYARKEKNKKLRQEYFNMLGYSGTDLGMYSDYLYFYGAVRRVPDLSGSWIAFDAAHAMFDPVAVDAALAATNGGKV